MSVIIHGLDMPKDGVYWCEIGIAGKIATITIHGEDRKSFPIVPLLEGHGRLVDAREVLEKADKAPWFDGDVAELGLLIGSEVTTIVPAEGGTEDEHV